MRKLHYRKILWSISALLMLALYSCEDRRFVSDVKYLNERDTSWLKDTLRFARIEHDSNGSDVIRIDTLVVSKKEAGFLLDTILSAKIDDRLVEYWAYQYDNVNEQYETDKLMTAIYRVYARNYWDRSLSSYSFSMNRSNSRFRILYGYDNNYTMEVFGSNEIFNDGDYSFDGYQFLGVRNGDTEIILVQ